MFPSPEEVSELSVEEGALDEVACDEGSLELVAAEDGGEDVELVDATEEMLEGTLDLELGIEASELATEDGTELVLCEEFADEAGDEGAEDVELGSLLSGSDE